MRQYGQYSNKIGIVIDNSRFVMYQRGVASTFALQFIGKQRNL